MPISAWNYKSQDADIRHIGPMAPDFNAAFGVGAPDANGDLKYINSLDADGVALASIQALYQRSQDQAAQIQALQAQLAQVQKTANTRPTGGLPVIWIILIVFQTAMFIALRRRPGGK